MMKPYRPHGEQRERGGRSAHGNQREKIYVYGKHALMEALANAPHVVRKVFLAHEMEDSELREALKKHHIPVEPIKAREADRMVGEDTAHQGVIAVADPGSLMIDFAEFERMNVSSGSSGAPGKEFWPNKKTMLVLLDELTDPHNVGAIIRSAAAFGAAGVLMPSHNQAPITGAVVKASAGMAFRVPLVSIGNVNQTVDKLAELGFKTYGLAMNGTQNLVEEKFDSPTLIIVGNEGAGIRQKTLERCDVKLSIPMDPRCESLNASVSAAVVLYQWSTKHLK